MKIGTVILAGGKSSRMGRDKAKINMGGETLLSRLVKEFDIPACPSEPLLSLGSFSGKDEAGLAEEYGIYRNSDGPLIWLEDIIGDAGPLGGLHAAMKHLTEEARCDGGDAEGTDDEAVFLLACDMPYMDRRFREWLVSEWEMERELTPELRALIPVDPDGGKKHYLAGIYSLKLSDELEAFLEKGGRRVGELLEDMGDSVKEVEIREPLIRRALMNVNEPGDLKKMQESMAPLFVFSGSSDSGKTELIRKLTRALAEKGYRVSYIKHTHHEIELPLNKDSSKITLAGALRSQVLGEGRRVMVEEGDFSLSSIVREESILGNADIIFAEGFKNEEADNRIVIEDRVIRFSWNDESLPLNWDDADSEGTGPASDEDSLMRVVRNIEERWENEVFG